MKNKSREFQRSLDFLGMSFNQAIQQNNTISSPENLKVLWAFCIPSEFNTNPTLAKKPL